jgi:hypothetical protein
VLTNFIVFLKPFDELRKLFGGIVAAVAGASLLKIFCQLLRECGHVQSVLSEVKVMLRYESEAVPFAAVHAIRSVTEPLIRKVLMKREFFIDAHDVKQSARARAFLTVPSGSDHPVADFS